MTMKQFDELVIGNIVGWDSRGNIGIVTSSNSTGCKVDNMSTANSQSCANECRMDCPDCRDDKCSWDPQ